jgi:hypothetical protein
MYKFEENLFATRHGSNKDAETLKEVLGVNLRFKVLFYENLKRAELKEKLQEGSFVFETFLL